MSLIHLTLGIIEFLLQTVELFPKVAGGLHLLRPVNYPILRK